jgi:ATP/maltotriose-dependent transcriptional regulator MalT
MHFQEALELYEAAGMSGGVARSQMHLGRVAWIAREYDRARDLLTACAPGLRQTRDRWSAAFALRTLALVECYAGQFEVARSHLRDSLAIWREVGGRVLLAQLIETSAILAAAAGSYSKAFRMAGAAAAQRLEIETPPTPTWQREIDRWLQRAHAEISVEASDRSFAEGKAMSIDDAVAEAEFREIQAGPALTPLTARELEILCLVASGSTNKEIAAHLHISVATVERHLGNLYGKIGARHRSDATAYAITRHLARQ